LLAARNAGDTLPGFLIHPQCHWRWHNITSNVSLM
jgi:hypothetical protein